MSRTPNEQPSVRISKEDRAKGNTIASSFGSQLVALYGVGKPGPETDLPVMIGVSVFVTSYLYNRVGRDGNGRTFDEEVDAFAQALKDIHQNIPKDKRKE